ncbi:copper amine oxidase N-terminal domain-containing protein [Paenibacillus artemisiicola]
MGRRQCREADLQRKSVRTESGAFRRRRHRLSPAPGHRRAARALVYWNAADQSVTMQAPERKARLAFGSTTATVNGREVALSAPLRRAGGQVFAPLRFFAEAFGVAVAWDEAGKTAALTQAKPFVKAYDGGTLWLNRGTGDLYWAKDEQSPVLGIGRVDADFQGELTIRSSGFSGGQAVITIVDKYGGPPAHYDAYEAFIRDRTVFAQKKASYDRRFDHNVTVLPVEDGAGGWLFRTVLTDGRTATVYDETGKIAEEYDLTKLAGAEDSYSLLSIGGDYLLVRPNRTGLLTLIDLKDRSVTALAGKLLTGKDLDYALHNQVPYPGDELSFAADMGHGQLDFFYDSPLGGPYAHDRLSYFRPSYAEEQAALPKPRTVREQAAGCAPETVKAVDMQDADQLYLPLIGADPDDRAAIAKVCGMLKKFASNGVREDIPKVPDDQFFHGMSIVFAGGDGAILYETQGPMLVYGGTGGKNSLVLRDGAAVHDFEALKKLPYMDIAPNPLRFGQSAHLRGDDGDTAKNGKLAVHWTPMTGAAGSGSLTVYEGTTTYGRYDVSFPMPAYGKAEDGTLRPIAPGKGYFSLVPYTGGAPFYAEVQPAESAFLSVNGVPAADPALMPFASEGRVYVPVRAVASLSGQPVQWDPATRAVLIRTKPSEAKRGAGMRLWIDGKPAAAELQPVLRGGTAYVPVRAVTAAFGLPVAWNADSRSVNVTVPPVNAAAKAAGKA